MDLEIYENSHGGEKHLGKKIILINSICEERGHYLVCWKGTTEYLLL